jgi:uncharacterized membrane protein
VDPFKMHRYAYAIFVALFSVLALAGFLATFGATADGEHLMAVIFTICTALTIHFIWLAWDAFQSLTFRR